MISEAEELEREIAEGKEALGENLAELEHQAKDLLDYRAQVRKHPRAMLGLAFGGGLLAALASGRSSGARKSRARPAPRRAGATEDEDEDAPSEAREMWDMFKGALVAAAATQVSSYVAELLPEFKERLDSRPGDGAGKTRRAKPSSHGNGNGEAHGDGSWDGDGAAGEP